MDPYELAEKIAQLILDKGFVYDEDLEYEFDIDEFDLIKAKNVLCRYYGIAVEKWHKDGEESRQAMFLTSEFGEEGGQQLLHRVFHDPDFKTRRRIKEENRKKEISGEIRELYDILQEEWGEDFKHNRS
ncbi:MAG: hypothetical protein JW854_03310 [Actinobacteria bacterium]|nr:hypothetical protein [Actinomycetota bacterium]